jgi:3-deoxy-manno-octulosonate cytidylyltransferase (CMP-KDO synthetase)
MIVVVIPARMGSSRLPLKLALRETGKPLLHHTIEKVLESQLASIVFVATPDLIIHDMVSSFDNPKVHAVMTGPAESGTERIARFCTTYFMDDDHVIVNFQGDEPELSGKYVDQLARMVQSGFCDVATLAAPATDEEAENQNVVKVIIDRVNHAKWFSRHPIPLGGPWLKHVGIYAYKVSFLRKLFMMPATTCAGERLEQLQWLQAGYRIGVQVDEVSSSGIDTRDQYDQFLERMNAKAG